MADYNPKARRPRTQVPADEPAPVDALLEAVEHLHDEVTPAGPAGDNGTPVTQPVVVDHGAGPVAPQGALSPPAANPWVSSVPAAPARSRRVVLVAAAVVAAVAAVIVVVTRRRR